MEALLNPPSPTDHLSSLRVFFYDIRGLETLGKKTETYGDILSVPIIPKKLPNGIKRNLARQNGNKEWQLDNLRKAILNEIEILEADRTALMITNSAVTSNTGDRPTKRICLFCKGEHRPTDCDVVTDNLKEKRHSIVRHTKARFNCLNRHSVSKCKSQNRGKVCHQKHYTSPCKNINYLWHNTIH